MRQLDPVHIPTPYFLKIHLNNILLSTPRSPKCTLSLRFPHQKPVYASPIPHSLYMPRPYHSSLFYHPHNIGWWTELIYLLTMPTVPLRIKYSPPFPVLKQPESTFVLQCEWPSFTPIQTTRTIKFLCILIFIFFVSKLEDKRFFTEW